MAIHDAYARLTPFELAFPDGGELLVSSVEEELGDAMDPGEVRIFLTLPAVSAYLAEIRAGDTGVEAIHPFGMLAYHAFHFVRAGCPLFLVETGVARRLVRGCSPSLEPRLPADSGYVQLPQHLFWTPGVEEAPESVDGFFWTRASDGLLHLLLATGMHWERPGLVVAPVASAPWSEAPEWLDASIRPDGEDYASSLPGGELEELYSLQAAGEVLKLMARLMAYLHGKAGVSVEGASGADPSEGPPASRLPYRRIVWTEDGDERQDG